MSYLLDTNVVSEIGRPNCNPNVRSWFATVSGVDLYLSALVIGEIRQGIERIRRRDPAQAEVFEKWLQQLRRDYADRVLPITIEVAKAWAQLNVPQPLPVVDGLIAATALVHRLTLVTRDVSGAGRAVVRVLNPFESGWS